MPRLYHTTKDMAELLSENEKNIRIFETADKTEFIVTLPYTDTERIIKKSGGYLPELSSPEDSIWRDNQNKSYIRIRKETDTSTRCILR